AGRTRVRQRWIRPRVLDAARHARRIADFRRVPVPVRDRSHPRVCDDAHVRVALESVHLDFRVEGAVRARALAALDGGDTQYLVCYAAHHEEVGPYSTAAK